MDKGGKFMLRSIRKAFEMIKAEDADTSITSYQQEFSCQQ